MAFWFNRMKKGGGRRADAGSTTAGAAGSDPSVAGASPAPADAASPTGAAGAGSGTATGGGTGTPTGGSAGHGGTRVPPRSTLGRMTDRLMSQAGAAKPSGTALNPKIVQAVQLSNAETTAYAPSQIAIGPDMMVSQAAGLVAQSAAAYFDGVSKLALASQGVLLKDMTESLVNQQLEKAAEDALGVLATDVMMGAAAAVAAAAGAMEAESASFAIDRIDQSISKYSDLLSKRSGKSGST